MKLTEIDLSEKYTQFQIIRWNRVWDLVCANTSPNVASKRYIVNEEIYKVFQELIFQQIITPIFSHEFD